MKEKTCSFFGHRKIELTGKQIEELKILIENLIVNEYFINFLFGSKSGFDYICHKIVTELKEKYPFIRRIEYTCKSETVVLESERIKWEQIYSKYYKKEVHLLGVEEEYHFKNRNVAGKASYIERNMAMIDNSDVFFIVMNIICLL